MSPSGGFVLMTFGEWWIFRVATCPGYPGIVLKFLLSLKVSWNREIRLIVLEIRPFTFSLSWKILNSDFLKTFRSLIACK